MSRLWDFIQIAPLRVRIPDIVCLQVQPEVYAKGKLSPLGSGLVRSEWKHGVEEPRVTALIAKEEHLSPLHARSDTRACDATLTIRDQRVRGTIRLDYLSLLSRASFRFPSRYSWILPTPLLFRPVNAFSHPMGQGGEEVVAE